MAAQPGAPGPELEEAYGQDSPAVQAHLSISQSVIQRMAGNSAAAKALCITLVSAVLVAIADKGKPGYASIAALPTLLFLGLDAYYLALEKCFRDSYNAFIQKLHRGEVVASDLYAVMPSGSVARQCLSAVIWSPSVLPFYGAIGVTVGLTSWLAFTPVSASPTAAAADPALAVAAPPSATTSATPAQAAPPAAPVSPPQPANTAQQTAPVGATSSPAATPSTGNGP